MRYAIPTCAVAALLAATPVMAEEAAADASPHTFSANVGLFSQYIFRGLSQTDEDPALQGGFDYAHSSGFYIGTWASNVSWLTEAQGYSSGSVEIDLYGGVSNEIGSSGVSYDVGLLQYFYPGSRAGATKADTLEAYMGLSWEWLSAKYSYALSDEVFGYANADGSWYAEVAAEVPLGDSGLTAGVHAGRQHFSGSVAGASNDQYSYNDYKVSLVYDMGKLGKTLEGTELGMFYTRNTTSAAAWNRNFFGDPNQFTAYIKRTF